MKNEDGSQGGEDLNSRAIGHYFFFCNKAKNDESQCRFARPVEDETKSKKERVCTFFAKTGSCKKGDKCMFSHDVVPAGKNKDKAKDDASSSVSEPEKLTAAVAGGEAIKKEEHADETTIESVPVAASISNNDANRIGSGTSSSSSSSDSSSSDDSDSD